MTNNPGGHGVCLITNTTGEYPMKTTTMKTKLFASILAFGLLAGTAIAQTGTASASPQTHHNAMMNGQMMGPGMMNGPMMGPGMMNGKMMGPGMMGMGCNGMMWNMTPQQRQEFMNQTRALRKQMMEKRFDYMEAMRNPATTPQDLAKIEKEMLELRAQMMDKMGSMHSK